jgi:hypothetical protein
MNLTRRKFLQASFLIGFAITTKKGWANKLPTWQLSAVTSFHRV